MKNKIKSIVVSLKKENVYLPLMVIIASVLCFFELTRNSYTFDEVTSIIISSNWHSMWHTLWLKEGNMWFYFMILNFWQRFGNSEFILRSLSAIFAVLTVPVFYYLAKNIHSGRVAKIATPLFITSLYFIFYAQMARSYILSLFLVTLSSYLFIKLIKNSYSIILLPVYILVSALAVYTHLLAILAIATQYVYLLVFPGKSPWKKVILAGVGIVACITPLLLAPSVVHGHQLDWLQKPPFVFLPFGAVVLAGDSIFATVLSGLIILVLLWKKKYAFFEESMERFYLLWLLLWAGFPILASFLFSLFARPIYQPQYFNASLPAFILLVALGLEELRQRKLIYKALLLILFAFSFLRLWDWYSGSRRFLTQYLVLENRHPDDWRSAASYVAGRSLPTDAVIFYAYYVHEPFDYYAGQYDITKLPKPIEISSGSYDIGGGTKIPEPNLPLLNSMSKKYPRVWLVLENNSTPSLGKKRQWNEIERELGKNYKVSSDVVMNQIRIKLFQRKAYEN